MAKTQVKLFHGIGKALSHGEYSKNGKLKKCLCQMLQVKKEILSLERRLNIELTSERRRNSGLRPDSFRAKLKSLAFFTAISIFNSINNPVYNKGSRLVVNLYSWVPAFL